MKNSTFLNMLGWIWWACGLGYGIRDSGGHLSLFFLGAGMLSWMLCCVCKAIEEIKITNFNYQIVATTMDSIDSKKTSKVSE